MPFFAVRYTYVDDSEQIAQVRPRHREYLSSLEESGSLRASGPLLGITPPGALLIFEAGSESDVRGMLAQDPFGCSGIVTDSNITQWDPVIGAFAAG